MGLSLLALPIATSAFWPLSTVARAQSTGGDAPLVHDSSLPLLAAAINSDPNPEKGGSDITLTEGSALMANSGPSGTLADLDSASPSTDQISTYTVKNGDSISGIASSFGVSVNTILWANDLTTKSAIKPGMTLVILPVTGIEHTVKSGETVASLAKKYGGTTDDILSYNGIEAGARLIVGDKIIIPNGEQPVVTAAVTVKPKVTVKKSVNLPSVSGFSNPLPGGICTQGIHDNNGVDIGAHAGTPIYAAAAGEVIIARMGWNGGFGNYVVINHPNGTQTLYGHMSQLGTTPGASVGKGELIGYVGSTGKSTGNHLHFEVHKATNPFCGSL
ncbi:MAG: peptidase family protein [Parcubacteria group bacterium]|nr:peptidase family protein [Parcubacteria group bacterium]